MQEYEVEKLTREANTARLRALRLAKEAGDVQNAKARQSAEEAASCAKISMRASS